MRSSFPRLTRYGAAAAVLAVGLDHLEQDVVDHYSVIPTIGTLFMENFAAALAVAPCLVVPLPRAWRRAGDFRALVACGGIAVAAGSAGALLLSERTGVFGFREVGYRPAVVVSLALDAVAILWLSATALGRTPLSAGVRAGAGPAASARG